METAHRKLLAQSMLPVMCQLAALDALGKQGYTIRKDIAGPLSTAFKAMLKGLRPSEAQEIGQTTMNTALNCLRGEGDDARQLMLAACMFSVKLVDEGLTVDPQNQATLVGLLMLADAEEDDQNSWGFDKKKVAEAGGRILSRARLQGLY
jgi:hypothetical protein